MEDSELATSRMLSFPCVYRGASFRQGVVNASAATLLVSRAVAGRFNTPRPDPALGFPEFRIAIAFKGGPP